MKYDVVIAGSGPAGLSAALLLGRARRSIVLCDDGPRRNAQAIGIHNFVTRDGIAPTDFRRVAVEQLKPYPSVEIRTTALLSVEGESGNFHCTTQERTFEAARVILCVGMIDDPLPIPGWDHLWGRSVFQCPYCHGWEARDGAFGVLCTVAPMLDYVTLVRQWSHDVIAFTNGAFDVTAEHRARAVDVGFRLEEQPIAALVANGDHLSAIELTNGTRVRRDVLFARPPQRQTDLVRATGVVLDDVGYVRVDNNKQTSRPGIYAAGDLTTPMQSAILAASAGTHAAAMLNHELTIGHAPG
jgi:thioredoxin reductase